MKTANIDREILNDLRNFNGILTMKDVTYDNIKSYKKPGFHPLSVFLSLSLSLSLSQGFPLDFFFKNHRKGDSPPSTDFGLTKVLKHVTE